MYDNFVLQRRKRFFHEQEDELVKDITPETTAGAKHYMSAAYENADWAVRAPKVIKRTAVSETISGKASMIMKMLKRSRKHTAVPIRMPQQKWKMRQSDRQWKTSECSTAISSYATL